MKGRATASDVIEALRKGPFQEPAHAWLFEVRNRTGWAAQERYADALVVSVWPSRGVWIAGVEVKVSRSDWRSELVSPEKSAEVQRFCDYWWVATPPGVVEASELPEAWGHFVVEGKKARKAKDAPRLTPEPLSSAFVASVLRNEAKKIESARAAGFADGHRKATEACDQAALAELRDRLLQAERDRDQLKSGAEWKDRDHARFADAVRRFEAAAGMEQGEIARGQNLAAVPAAGVYRAAKVLQRRDAEEMAARFEDAARALRAVDEIREEMSA